MNHRHDRRTFLKTTSGLLLVPALGMGAITARAAASCPDVIVGTWGGDYETLLEKNIGEPIIKAAGGNVTYATADQVSRMTKMRAEKTSRRGSMDVSCLVDTDMFDMSRADVLQPVDASMVPNNANTMEQFRKPYAIPHIFSAMVIVYNPTKITQAPDSFNLALDPRLKGRVGLSDILYAYVGMTASLAAGDHKAGFAAGTKFLRELKKKQPKVYPSNEALAAALKNGDVWMTCMWKARALQWKKAGVPVEFAFPTEGALPAVFEAAVMKNSQNKPCGFNYLNAMLDPRAQAGFAATMGYAPTVRNVQLPPDLQSSVGFTDAQLKKFVQADYQTFVEQRPAFLDYWTKDFKVGL
ncbi:extracellular solute-binding protein [Burkholderia sp. L27(2015)]|uniref:extracellular solute-binding protein n=1 Tax=Burkholderia sp. L27(2015) TaxID=1641858 RepID=UPI00131E6E2A|nr:extracellular solute-binding protein [Burkholderia sp. L27(2015)]